MPYSAARPRILRRSRALAATPRYWRQRLVFWLGALAIGIVSAGFALLADKAQLFFEVLCEPQGWRRYLPLLVTPLGFALCAFVAARFVQGSQGSGIPQAIAARHLREDADRSGFLSLRIAVGKIVMTVLGLACGASIGREGPTVQVGASIMLQVARWSGMAQARGLILAGSAAGIAAAFNTPLAGIVFAIEEMSKTYQARTNGIVLSAVIIAGLASLAIVGNYTYFGVTNATAVLRRDWLLVLVCGIVGGGLGAGFSMGLIGLTRRLRRWRASTPLVRTVAVAALAGLLVAAIGIAAGGTTFGTGYLQARGAIEGTPLPAGFFLAKLAATLASSLSGIPGGLFAPSLSIGAGLGSTLGTWLGSPIALAAVLGMAGYFSGVVQAPMTAFVIILEMTGNHDNVLALMTVSMLGYGTARLVTREPLYHALSRLFIADVLRNKRARAAPPAAQTGASF